MSRTYLFRRLLEPWRLVVCVSVVGFLLLGILTHTFKPYHLATLIAVPGALVAAEAGRRFFVEWGPLMGTWIAYDRLRLVQPWLLDRVAVAWPFETERFLFGWMAGGDVPAHASRIWLATHAASPLWSGFAVAAQVIYFSHLVFYPLLFLGWWFAGFKTTVMRDRARRFVAAFAILNVIGFVCYVAIPAAPPWWVSAHGMAAPTAYLVARTDVRIAMDGSLIQHLLATAPNWFAAIPSLHGGYPVLLFLLARSFASKRWLAAIAAYGAAMWIATVVLNQHYIIDLVLGALVAFLAFRVTESSYIGGILARAGGRTCDSIQQSSSA